MAGHYKATNSLYNGSEVQLVSSDGKGFKKLPPVPKIFNESGKDVQLSGFMRPVRFEGEIDNLEFEGTIPPQIRGTFYRVMPEPQFPNYLPGDPWFNGDGNVSAFKIENGHVDLKQKYVQTEKFIREHEARRALTGKYRNRYTDAIDLKVKSTANTNVFYWNGKLLALKEDSPPYAMDPTTLETISLWDFDGQLPSVTFTAHPKFDPVTRELVCFGYEAKGDATLDVCYYSINQEGKFTETTWMVAPVCGMIHDFGITENYVLFPMIPHICDLDRMKAGGEHWQWDNTIPMYIGVLPRRGAQGSDVKWFRAPHGFAGHVANSYEDTHGNIILEMAYSRKNVFFWWADKDGNAPSPGEAQCDFVSFSIDPKATDLDLGVPKSFVKEDMEFPRIDDRYVGLKYEKVLFNVMDPAAGTDMSVIGPVLGGGHPLYNSIGFYNTTTSSYSKYFAGPHKLVQEPVFIPRSKTAKECDGFVMALLNNYKEMTSELVIVDTADMSKHVALVKLPIRLRTGLHGNWVDAGDTDGHPSNE